MIDQVDARDETDEGLAVKHDRHLVPLKHREKRIERPTPSPTPTGPPLAL